MTSHSPPLSFFLYSRAIILVLATGILLGSAHFISGSLKVSSRLDSTQLLVEQRYNTVLAQSIWDLDVNNIQQLLDSIARMDGIHNVELQTTLGQRMHSQVHDPADTQLIRDFPIISERSGNQPIATLRLHLGRQDMLAELLRQSLALTAAITLSMLTLLLLCKRFIQQHISVRLEQISRAIESDEAPSMASSREMDGLGRSWLKTRQNWQEQNSRQVHQIQQLQLQREQLGEILSTRTQEVEQLSRQLQWLQGQSSRLTNLQSENRSAAIEECLHRVQKQLDIQAVGFAYFYLPNMPEMAKLWFSHQNTQIMPLLLKSSWLRPPLENGDSIAIAHKLDIPPDGHSEYLHWSEHGIESIFLQPIQIAGNWHGIMACLDEKPHQWSESEQALIAVCCDLLATAAHLLSLQEVLDRQQQKQARANHAVLDYPDQDNLTGIASLARLNKEKAYFLELALTKRIPFAIIMLDIDHFHTFNGHRGQQAGDECLLRIANTLQSMVNNHSSLAVRHGGKSFLLVLQDCKQEQGEQICQTLLHEINAWQIPHPASATGFLSISIGLACYATQRHSTFDDVIEDARQALYLAKQRGRNRYCLPPIR